MVFRLGKGKSDTVLLLIHPIVESESSLILPIPLKELTRWSLGLCKYISLVR